jgi:hypothetical protein
MENPAKAIVGLFYIEEHHGLFNLTLISVRERCIRPTATEMNGEIPDGSLSEGTPPDRRSIQTLEGSRYLQPFEARCSWYPLERPSRVLGGLLGHRHGGLS